MRRNIGRGVLITLGLLAVASIVVPATFVGFSVRMAVHSLVALQTLGACPALAQETLKFEAIPEESLETAEGAGRRIFEESRRAKSGDIMRVGSDIHIEEDEIVRGDVLAIRGDVTVEGEVEGNVVAMGGDVYLQSTARVDGDVVCMGGRMHEEPGATVGGQRVTALDRAGKHGGHPDIDIDVTPEKHWDSDSLDDVFETVIKFLIVLGMAWLLARLASGSTGAALMELRSRPARSLGIGMLIWLLAVPSMVALAFVVVVLCVTIIGIPLAIVALLGYFVFFALLIVWGYTVGAAALGEKVLERRGEAAVNLTRATMAGVILLGSGEVFANILEWLDNFLPLVGILGKVLYAAVVLASIVVTSMGAGAWLHTESTSGTLGRWWRGSSARIRRTAPRPPDPPPTGGAPATPYSTPPPPPMPGAGMGGYTGPAASGPAPGSSSTDPA
jgi:hypothetical protein